MSTFRNLGFNLRLSDIQAAVGVAQMAKLDRLLDERRARALRYTEKLRELPELAMPSEPAGCGHTYQSYVIRVLAGGRVHRNRIMDALQTEGIQTRPGTHAVHRLDYYSGRYGLRPGDFPRAAECEDSTITLPIFPGMTDVDQDRVIAVLRRALLG